MESPPPHYAALTAAGAQIHPPSPVSSAVGDQIHPSSPRSCSPGASLLELIPGSPASVASQAERGVPEVVAASRSVEFNAPNPSLGGIHGAFLLGAGSCCPERAGLCPGGPDVDPSAPSQPKPGAASVRPRLRSIIVAPDALQLDASGRRPSAAAPPSPAAATSAAPATAAVSSHPWQEVRPKHWSRTLPMPLGDASRRRSNSAPLRQSSAFKARFAGKCYRCLSDQHLLKNCSERVRCIRCKEPGHIARFCHLHAHAAPKSLPQARPPPRPVQPLLPSAPSSC
ncbi:hypothetical protein ZWY2020_002701 [Hordeum vulgare]|nr:hypothetical protein ZWY2020_002701 [Hordeum vulgare]